MGTSSTVFSAIFKKSSTFALTLIVGAFVFESVTDHVAELIFNKVNEGKLWHHIKDKYEEA